MGCSLCGRVGVNFALLINLSAVIAMFILFVYGFIFKSDFYSVYDLNTLALSNTNITSGVCIVQSKAKFPPIRPALVN